MTDCPFCLRRITVEDYCNALDVHPFDLIEYEHDEIDCPDCGKSLVVHVDHCIDGVAGIDSVERCITDADRAYLEAEAERKGTTLEVEMKAHTLNLKTMADAKKKAQAHA